MEIRNISTFLLRYYNTNLAQRQAIYLASCYYPGLVSTSVLLYCLSPQVNPSTVAHLKSFLSCAHINCIYPFSEVLLPEEFS